MGMTSFLHRLEATYVKQRDQQGLPEDVPLDDPERLREFLRSDFTEWFLRRRDTLLGEEWVQRGWAERVKGANDDGYGAENYRVKSESVELIDAWLNDKLD